MEQENSTKFLPWWVWLIVAIEAIVPTVFGIATIVNPSIWGAESLGELGQLYVTRNFTMALGIVIAVILRNYTALFCIIAVRYCTDFIDISASFIRGVEDPQMPVMLVFVVLLLVIPLFGLRWLWQNR